MTNNSATVIPMAVRLETAARLLDCSIRTIERLIARGELVAIGRGKLRRVLYESIVAYLNRNRNEAA